MSIKINIVFQMFLRLKDMTHLQAQLMTSVLLAEFTGLALLCDLKKSSKK